MARLNRLKLKDSDAYYHVMSRTVGQEFLLKNSEKDKFIELLFDLSQLYFVKVIGFSIMSNHFHLLIKMEVADNFIDEEIISRVNSYYRKAQMLSNKDIRRYREKLGDISEFMKMLKQNFSYWYNREHNRKGHFWSDRFKSVLVENGESLLNCLAYIDLNSVRANIADIPEDYIWSSVSLRMKNCENGRQLSWEGVSEIQESNSLNEYLKYLYFAGRIIISEPMIKKKDNNFIVYSIKPGIFRSKMKIFSDSWILGSSNFVKESYGKFENTILKQNKEMYKSEYLENVYIARRQYEQKSH